jgi:O-antigen/teichoic acid export membrane protein
MVNSIGRPHILSVVRTWHGRLTGSTIGRRFAHGALWSLLGAVASRGLQLAAFVVVARTLGEVRFGELGVTQSTVGMFATFAGLGLGVTAAKHVAEFRRTDPEQAGKILSLSEIGSMLVGACFALALFGLAPLLAKRTLAAPHLAPYLRASAVFLFFTTLNDVQTGGLSGFEAFRAIARVSVWGGITTFVLLALGAYGWGVHGAVWGMAASASVSWALSRAALRREIAQARVPVRRPRVAQDLRVLWEFSLPAVMAGAMVGPVNWMCSAIVVNGPAGYAEMGFFSAANQWRMAILFLPNLIAGVALPILAGLYGARDHIQHQRILYYSVFITGCVSFCVALAVSLLSPWIMFLYGKGYAARFPVLILLAICAVLMAMCTLVGQGIASEGRMWAGFSLNAIWGATLVTATWFWRDRGADGLASANVLAYGVHLVTTALYVFSRRRRGAIEWGNRSESTHQQ